MQAGKGKGYEQWAKVFNLKEAANTLNFLTKHGITDYEELTALTEETGKKFDALSAQIKQLEGRMAKTAQLKMHIINYSKTREIYAAYKKSGKKEVFLTEHKEEIEKHEAFKEARKAMVEYQTAKDNVDRILGTALSKKEQEKNRESHR